MRKWLVNGALVVASLVVALALAEGVLRLVGYANPVLWTYDDVTGSRLYAGAQGWFRSEGEAYITINSDGLRDREHAKAKPPNTLRIAVLGDSMTEALQVPLEKYFGAVLEQRLNECRALGGRSVEVINFGVSGYGTAQEFLIYRQRVTAYSPDVVVLGLYPGNDIRNNSKQLEPNKMRPFYVLRDGKLTLDDSFRTSSAYESFKRTFDTRRALFGLRIFQLARQARTLVAAAMEARAQPGAATDLEAGSDDKVFLPPATPAWADAWAVTEALLVEMRNAVRDNGQKLVVVSIPIGIQAHPDAQARQLFMRKLGVADLWYPDRRLRAFAERSGVDVMSLGAQFQEYAERNEAYLYGFKNTRLGSGHLNENGHRLIGEALAAHLCPSP